MRIVFVTMQFGPGYYQGTERYIRTLAAELLRAGHQVTVLGGDPHGHRPGAKLGEDAGDPDLDVRHVETSGWPAIEGDPSIRSVLDELKPDLLHAANPAHVGVDCLAWARENGIPSVITTMDLWWAWPIGIGPRDLSWGPDQVAAAKLSDLMSQAIEQHDPRPLMGLAMRSTPAPILLRAVLAWESRKRGASAEPGGRWWKTRGQRIAGALRSASAVIYPSRGTRDLIEPLRSSSEHAGSDRTIPYGLEPEWFSSDPVPSEPSLLFAGALSKHKGLHTLLEALKISKTKPPLTVAGGWHKERRPGAGYRARCEALAEGLDIGWAGWLKPEQLRAELARCSVSVVPSTWRENLPFSVLEAHAAQRPVLASDITGVVEQVPEPWRFEPGNAQQLADRIDAFVGGSLTDGMGPVMTSGQMLEATLQVYADAGG